MFGGDPQKTHFGKKRSQVGKFKKCTWIRYVSVSRSSQCRIEEQASAPQLKIQRDESLQCYPEFREVEAYSVTPNLERWRLTVLPQI